MNNEPKALHLLENLSYYRLSAYLYPQLKDDKESHLFKNESYLESAFKMYCFDRELRLLLASNIEKIEISFRAKLTYVMSHNYDAFWYTYDKLFRDNNMHKGSLVSINKSYNDSTEDFVVNYKKKYLNSYLPSWMALEIVTFSHLSKLFKNIKDNKSKSKISKYYGVPYQLLENWLLVLTYTRNICAHHSRFWNRDLLKVLKANKTLEYNWIEQKNIARNKAYIYLSITKYLLDRVNPNNSFKSNISSLFDKYSNIDYLKSMGFPEDWEKQPLWNDEFLSTNNLKKDLQH